MYASVGRSQELHRKRPFFSTRDVAQERVGIFADQTLEYLKKAKQVSIGVTAVDFYFLNHAASVASHQARGAEGFNVLHDQVFDTYCREGNLIGERMAHDIFYMLHAMLSFTHPTQAELDYVRDAYNPECADLLALASGQFKDKNTWWTPNQKEAVKGVHAISQSNSKARLGDWIDTVGQVLRWRQKELAYGPLWSDVANMFGKYLHGRTSLETLIDTSFTFCHCNGSFFEKGTLFSAVGNNLFDVLDIQRSGQIPQMVHERKAITSTRAQEWGRQFAPMNPELFLGKVNHSNVAKVSRDSLVFTQKYAAAWNRAWGGAGGVAQAPAKPVPKVFNPIDEEGYLDLLGSARRPGQ